MERWTCELNLNNKLTCQNEGNEVRGGVVALAEFGVGRGWVEHELEVARRGEK